MNPKYGEVWMVDMGLAGKVRPAVVVLDDTIDVQRALILVAPVTSKNRGTELEAPLGHLRFLTQESVANIQAITSLPGTRFERKLGHLPAADLQKVKTAITRAFGLNG